MNILGIIPARGGSKRVPKKNTRLLGGEPLIAYTICCARFCVDYDVLEDAVVSSDDDEILSVAKHYDSKTLKRPPEMASDGASSYPLILHALKEMGAYEYICLLQPTSPFRTPEDVGNCVKAMTYFNEYPAWATAISGEGVPNGAVYIARTDWLRDSLANGVTHPFDGPAVARVDMPWWRSIDIDTENDFIQAEQMIDKLTKKGY